MFRLRFRLVAALMLVLHLAGCVTWKPIPLDPPDSSQLLPKRVRVTTTETVTRFRVREARFENDSIVGKPQGADTRVGFVLSEVESVEVGKVSWLRTFVATVVIPYAILATLYSLSDCRGGLCPDSR